MNAILESWKKIRPTLDRVLDKLNREKNHVELKRVYMYLEGVAHKITDAIYSMDANKEL